jgi:hypothetical protein
MRTRSPHTGYMSPRDYAQDIPRSERVLWPLLDVLAAVMHPALALENVREIRDMRRAR